MSDNEFEVGDTVESVVNEAWAAKEAKIDSTVGLKGLVLNVYQYLVLVQFLGLDRPIYMHINRIRKV